MSLNPQTVSTFDTRQTDWLTIAAQGSFNEVYVLDYKTLRFAHVNEAACLSLQYEQHELVGMSPTTLVEGLTEEALRDAVAPLMSGEQTRVVFDTFHRRKDGSIYPIEFRLFHAFAASGPLIVAIGNDVSSRKESAEALVRSESRFRAIVSNTPGLVYQFLLGPDGSISYPYLSEGCHALLGIAAEKLHADSAAFTELILAEDCLSYIESMNASAAEMKAWNWEGRIWIEEWRDTKWINLRATPRALSNGSVLWEGIMTNITESKQEQAEIIRSRAQLAELSAHVETVKEKERTRIAREIHDDVGGNLTAIKMALSLLTRRLPDIDATLLEKAAYVDSLIDRTFEAVHRIAGDLRPGILDFGIVAAIDWQAKEFEKQTSLACEVTSSHKEIALHPDQATALFRIFQEALTNISKHAQATRVAVRLERSFESLRLEVMDNGRGIKKSDRLKPKSFGLRGMAERAAALGGNLSISNAAGGGSRVAIEITL